MSSPSADLQTGPSDAELMRRLGQGELPALGLLVERHQDRVRALAWRIVGGAEADDIAQEAFLRLQSGAARYRPTAALSTWLHRIVVNLCLDWCRKHRPTLLPDGHPGLVRADTSDSPPEAAERRAAIRRAVEELPERQRVALVLHRFEGLGHAEIAELTGWSESAVESLLVRAYGALRERLQEWA